MIVLRRVEERQSQRAPRRLTLRAAKGDAVALGLFDLWLAPAERIELDAQLRCELLTYVVTGSLVHARGTHTHALIDQGELHCVAIASELNTAHVQLNPSFAEGSHVIQLLIYDPRRTLEFGQGQKRLSIAQRRGQLCAVAGPDASTGLLQMQSETTLYSAVLEPGQHLVHGFAAAHSGILHVLSGELSVEGYVLGPGDSVHVQAQRSLAFTAREHAEVLLGDVSGFTSF